MFRGPDAVDFPDVYSLFTLYNAAYFEGLLSDVLLQWSSRLTVAAGVCIYKGTRRYEVSPITIRLSSQLLQFRGPQDIASVLLHEMIHAYLFRLKVFESDPHGPIWLTFAARINMMERENGVVVTPYHNFTMEVEYAREQQRLRSLERKRKALEREERQRLGFHGKSAVLPSGQIPAAIRVGRSTVRNLGSRTRRQPGKAKRPLGPCSLGARGGLVPIAKFVSHRVPADAYRITNFSEIAQELKAIYADFQNRFDRPLGSQMIGPLPPVSSDSEGLGTSLSGFPRPISHETDSDLVETIIVDGGESCISISDSSDDDDTVVIDSENEGENVGVVDLSRVLSSGKASICATCFSGGGRGSASLRD